MSRNKSTKLELEKRLNEVAEMMLAGQRRAAIHTQIRGKYNVSESQCDRYIRKIKERVLTEFECTTNEKVKELAATISSRLEFVYGKAISENALKTATDALNSLAKINGVGSSTVNVNQTSAPYKESSEDDLLSIINGSLKEESGT